MRTSAVQNIKGEFIFDDYPEFTPNLSPKDIFQLGSFGGTYWRPIHSNVTNKSYKNEHKKFPLDWFENIEVDRPFTAYSKALNKYNVNVGQSLEIWEDKNWIHKTHPYGWVQWYCSFFLGHRCEDDVRQIKRWSRIAGKNGRFRKWLISLIDKKKRNWDDHSVSPKIRQTLQHWAYVLTFDDYND